MAKKSSTIKESSTAGSNGHSKAPGRLSVLKTYKLYVNGAFPRTESGRYYELRDPKGKLLANVCQGSRKDFREAVKHARKAQSGWCKASALLKGQILYRIAEMLEGRADQFVAELKSMGSTEAQARKEVAASIDRLVHYAGWCDKYQQIFSSVNPVASSHFNFSLLEPTGVVSMFAAEENGLLGLVSAIAPAIAGGNAVVVLASESKPLSAITFGEVLHHSDLPAGVVNILTGNRAELLPHFAGHMDVNAIYYAGSDANMIRDLKEQAVANVKRVVLDDTSDWYDGAAQGPYRILDFQETKTTWHPIGI